MKKILGFCFLASTCLADSFSGRLLVYPQWTHTKAVGASTVEETFDSFLDWTHTSGTSNEQMNVVVRQAVSLTNSAEQTYNLSGGVTDAFGDATTLQTVRFLCLTSDSSNTNDVQIGGGGSDAWADWVGNSNHTVRVKPGGMLLLVAPYGGYSVTNSASLLKITNDGTNATSGTLYIGGVE